MKILEIIPQLASGGAERFTVDLCNELSKNNEITLLTFFPLNEYGFYTSELSPRVNLLSLNKKKGFNLKAFFTVAKYIRKNKPAVVHMHLRSLYYCLLPILFFKNTKYFMTIHSDADKEAENVFGRIIRRLCFKNGLVVPVTIAPHSQKLFNQYYNLPSKMIYNGRNVCLTSITVTPQTIAEVERCKNADKDRVIINLARINEVKRQNVLAKVVNRLYKEGYSFTLIIVGNKRDEKMVNEINSYSCPLIHLLGEKTNPLEYLKLSDAYCLCSSYEGLPISLIEALGVGVIPICTPVGGIVDVVTDGYNGILSMSLSEEDIYLSLKKFLDMPDEKINHLKANALKTYESYSMVECAKKYLNLFTSV